jgi:hypothetical protein
MHWGTFENMTDEPLDEPTQWLDRKRQAMGPSADQFDLMKIGETRAISAAAR